MAKSSIVLVEELRKRLRNAVAKNPMEGILFSGGLDTSILAVLNPHSKAITVTFQSSGQDIRYARIVVNHLRLEHYHRTVEIEEALGAIPQVIKTLKSFDPAIPNDIVVYFGLKSAQEMGWKGIMTGDGADELLAGYSYMAELDDLEGYIKRIEPFLFFSSNKLAKFFDLRLSQPYLDERFRKFALKIPKEFKIKEEKGSLRRGKWILRKAFEGFLPGEVIWQDKRPLEYGSGMTGLRAIIESRISDKEFEEKKRRYPVKFITKDHLYYYEIYLKEVGDIPKPGEGQKSCTGCGAGIGVSSFHCKVCGNLQEGVT